VIDDFLTLADGRVVGWANYGDPRGRPVVCVHGSPDSHAIWQLFDDVAHEHELRLLAIDRPGFGLSDELPDRQVLDWPHDLEQVADHLGLVQFPVIAISGGAAYAAAAARSARSTPVHASSGPAIAAISSSEMPACRASSACSTHSNVDPQLWAARSASSSWSRFGSTPASASAAAQPRNGDSRSGW
jgi:pimeloyl-ACP methyl ester carboxylesterase